MKNTHMLASAVASVFLLSASVATAAPRAHATYWGPKVSKLQYGSVIAKSNKGVGCKATICGAKTEAKPVAMKATSHRAIRSHSIIRSNRGKCVSTRCSR